MLVWALVFIVTEYILSSPPAIIGFWEINAGKMFIATILVWLECQACLLGLKLAILRVWNSKNPALDGGGVLPIATVTLATYLLLLLFLASMISTASGLLPSISLGLVLVCTVVVMYLVAVCNVSINSISELNVSHFLLPVSGRFRGVASLPTIDVIWVRPDVVTTLCESFALARWACPLFFVLLVAFSLRFAIF